MSITVNTAQINAAATGDSNALRETLLAMQGSLGILHQATGTAPVGTKVDSTVKASQKAPAAASFTVSGANGNFTVAITNPANPSKSILQHELSSSPVATFATGVTTYTLSTSVAQVFPNPGAALYWRLRSTVDGVTFNAYKVQPGAVNAGLLTTPATNPNLSLNQSNYATVDSVANGASASVRMYGSGGPGTGWPRRVGIKSPVIPGGTLLNVPYGSDGFVAYDGEKYQLKTQLPETFPDGWLPVGAVSTIANAGGLVQPVVSAVVVSGSIVAYQITNQGNDIFSVTITVTDSTGSGANPVGEIQNGKLVNVSGSAGSGYSSHPTVTVVATASPGSVGGGGNNGNNGGRLYTVNN